ncbi:hypothetical protein BDV12DRAFT_204844 [Aspergillus spectabilis]
MLRMLIVRRFENQASSTLLSVPRFKEKFGVLQDGQYFIATNWQSAVNGGPQAGSILGSLAASYFSDIIGYKITLLVAAVLNIASIGVEFASTSIAMFFRGTNLRRTAIACTVFLAQPMSGLAFVSS